MGSIRVVSGVPGPRSAALAIRAQASVGRSVAPGPAEVFIARGHGAVVEDVDGNALLDFTGGLGCLAVGHAHPAVVSAIQQAAALFVHTDYSVVAYESYGTLAAGLAQRCGGGSKVAFFNSGAEAVENAVKIARAVTGRPGMVCFQGAFHGRTSLAMALTDREVPYKAGFGPFPPEIYRLPYPGFAGATMATFTAAAEQVFSQRAIAAAIVEPELGEGGYVVPPPGFLPELERIAHAHGALLIVDEIQSGYGRTGAFLASELAGVRPDLVVLGKSIAAGLPLSAVVGDAEVMDQLDPGRLGGTYPGNPLALAAGMAVLEVIDHEGLLGSARHIGGRLRRGWEAIAAAVPGLVTDIRGLGCMVGVEFASRDALAALRAAALQRGLLTVTAGAEARVLRHLMPLVTTDEQLDEAFAVFGEAAATALG
jgi:4-aminobutyrate aminotransferase/(S)-3-amino-2-methylpropionate transaminase